MHPAKFVVRQWQSNLENEMNTLSEQKKQKQVKMMTRLPCSGARRLLTIRAPADRAARERRTTTNVPIALQHLWTGSNKKIHHHGFSIDCQTTTTESSRTKSEKELLTATESRNTRVGRGGYCTVCLGSTNKLYLGQRLKYVNPLKMT